jgi:hypothetical protein
MREGLLALPVGIGLQVLAAPMEEDVAARAGRRHVRSRVVLAGARVLGGDLWVMLTNLADRAGWLWLGRTIRIRAATNCRCSS